MSPTRPRDLSTSCASNRDENPMLSFLLELTEIHSIRSVHHLTSCFTNRRTSLEGCFRRPFTCLPISVSCRVISRKISTLFGVIRRKRGIFQLRKSRFLDEMHHLESSECDIHVRKVLQQPNQRIFRLFHQTRCNSKNNTSVGRNQRRGFCEKAAKRQT